MLPRRTRSPAAALLAAAALATAPLPAHAQGPDTTAAPNVGQDAPDFTAPAATRYGLLRDPVTLSALRGTTVVLAFFYKARTKG